MPWILAPGEIAWTLGSFTLPGRRIENELAVQSAPRFSAGKMACSASLFSMWCFSAPMSLTAWRSAAARIAIRYRGLRPSSQRMRAMARCCDLPEPGNAQITMFWPVFAARCHSSCIGWFSMKSPVSSSWSTISANSAESPRASAISAP